MVTVWHSTPPYSQDFFSIVLFHSFMTTTFHGPSPQTPPPHPRSPRPLFLIVSHINSFSSPRTLLIIPHHDSSSLTHPLPHRPLTTTTSSLSLLPSLPHDILSSTSSLTLTTRSSWSVSWPAGLEDTPGGLFPPPHFLLLLFVFFLIFNIFLFLLLFLLLCGSSGTFL